MRRPPPALRHVVIHWAAFSAAAITTLITAAFTAAAFLFFSAVIANAGQSELSAQPGSAIVVTATVTHSSVGSANAQVAHIIQGLLPGITSISTSVQSDDLNMPGRKATSAPLAFAARPAGSRAGSAAGSRATPRATPRAGSTVGSTRLQTQLVSLPGLASHVVLVSGTCHGSGGYPIAACVPQAAASVLGLTTGDRLTLHDAITGAPVRVLITGIFLPRRPDGSYWALDPLGAGEVQVSGGFTTAGPLVTSPSAATGGHFPVSSSTWLGMPDFYRLTGSGVAALASRITNQISSLPVTTALPDAIVTTNLPTLLEDLATDLVVTRAQMLASMLTLLVVAGATLSMAVRLLAQRREAEAALLAARGASRIQLARRGLVDAALIAVPAAVIGPLIGARLAPVLIRSSAVAVPGHSPASTVTLSAWLVTAAVALGCVAIIALPWLRRPPSPLRRRAVRGRQRAVAAAVYARADLAVVLIAGGATWQLIRSSGPVSAGLNGTLSADPILVVAPVLALVAGALLTLRALPLAARLGDRVAARGRGLILPAAAWQISRGTLRQTGPTLVAVLAVGAAVMAVSQRDSFQQSAQAQASFDVGADMRVTMPPSASVQLAQVAGITAARGVTASAPAVRSSFVLPNGSQGTLLALNTSEAAAVIPASAAGPSPALLRRLAASSGTVGVQVPGRPAALRLTVRLGRSDITQPVLLVQLTDAAGVAYQIAAGPIRADGRSHFTRVMISARREADYPLRVTGFSLQYLIPVSGPNAADTLTVSGAQALPAAGSATGTAFPLAAAHSHLLFNATGPGNDFAGTRAGITAPAVTGVSVSSSGSISAAFTPGAAPSSPGTPATISLAENDPAATRALPAVVTSNFLTATSQRAGADIQVSLDGTTLTIVPVGVVANLPTVTDGSPSVLIDQGALNDALQAAGIAPLSANEWWLRTSGHPALTGLPSGTSISERAGVASSLLADPLSKAVQLALLAIAIAAVLLAGIGLLVSVATAAERARDAALLDALGMPTGQVARLLGLEQAMTVIVTSVIGMLFGAALSEVLVPALTLTQQAVRPVPAIVVQLPWLLAAVVVLVMVTVPTVTTMLDQPRRASAAARIRLEDDI